MNHGSQAEDKMIDETQETPAYDDERDYTPPREADEHFEGVDEADDDDFDDEEFEDEGEDNGGGEAQPKPKTVKVFDTEKKLKTL